MAPYEDAWLRENDQTHRSGWVPILFLTCALIFTSNSTSSSTVSYFRVVAIAHAQAPKWFRAQNDGKSQDFFLRNNFPVVSWGFYVHFREETRIFIKEKAQYEHQFLR